MDIFIIKDKTGKNIRLTQKQWGHICEHPEMGGKVEDIKEVLEHPDTALMSNRDSKVHYYFRFSKEKAKYLLVAVKYLNGDGFIITSFYSSKIQI